MPLGGVVEVDFVVAVNGGEKDSRLPGPRNAFGMIAAGELVELFTRLQIDDAHGAVVGIGHREEFPIGGDIEEAVGSAGEHR